MPLSSNYKPHAVSEHDPHSSFIKTPKQLIVVILLAFLVPVILIVMLVQLATSRPSPNPNALNPDAVAERLRPVGTVEFGAPQAAPGMRSGEAVVKAVCLTCHQAGVANAPKLGDQQAWAPRIKQGLDTLVQSVIKGKGAMPPKGGDAALTEEEAVRAVVYMANQSGANFKEPPAPKEAAKPAPQAQAAVPIPPPPPPAEKGAAQKPAASAANGKAVYDKTCVACHSTGVAGAPKLGDKAAWAPRIKDGMDVMVEIALKGKGAMPPKGGNPSLSEAEVRAAVEFMVSQSK